MSDPVAIALITGVTSTVTTLATLVLQVLTRRRVGKLDQTVRDQHAMTRQTLSAAGLAPHDVSITGPRPSSPRRKE